MMGSLHAIGFLLIISTFLSPSTLTANSVLRKKKDVPPVLKPYVPSSQNNTLKEGELHPCICGIFLGSQVPKKGGPAVGDPVLQHTYDSPCLPQGPVGVKICTNKCIELVTKYLPKSKDILCAVVDKDIEREKAHLFVKNCEDVWVNTNLSSGHEYCCKDGSPYPCSGSGTSFMMKKPTE